MAQPTAIPVASPPIKNAATASAVIPADTSVGSMDPAENAIIRQKNTAPLYGVRPVRTPPAAAITAVASKFIRRWFPVSIHPIHVQEARTNATKTASPRPWVPGGFGDSDTVTITISRPTARSRCAAGGRAPGLGISPVRAAATGSQRAAIERNMHSPYLASPPAYAGARVDSGWRRGLHPPPATRHPLSVSYD